MGGLVAAQTTTTDPSLDPHLLLSLQDFEARKAIVQREPWLRLHLMRFSKRPTDIRRTTSTDSALLMSDGTIAVHGPGWVDTVTLGDVIRYHRSAGSETP